MCLKSHKTPFSCLKKNSSPFHFQLSRIRQVLIILVFLVSVIGPTRAAVVQAANLAYVGDVGSATSKTSGTSLVITTTAAVAAGDDIIIAYVSDPNQSLTVSIADSAGNTYNQVSLAINSGNLRLYLFTAYNVNALASGSSITITANTAVTARNRSI
jgi:hypothetical protein